MTLSKIIRYALVAVIAVSFTSGCAKDDTHWGQKIEVGKKWWKKEGQSWDRKTNIFMAIGYSNPDLTEKHDLRKSADLDARSQVASFMQSLVKNYLEEVRSNNFSISESVVEASAKETILGSVIVERKYIKKRKHPQYLSLIKVDLGYFFSRIYNEQRRDLAARIKRDNKRLDTEDLDRMIEEKTEAAVKKLKAIEEPAVEKSIGGET